MCVSRKTETDKERWGGEIAVAAPIFYGANGEGMQTCLQPHAAIVSHARIWYLSAAVASDLYLREQDIDREQTACEPLVEFYLDNENAQATIKEVGYVPLPTKACHMAATKFENRELDTVFHGSEVGIGIAKRMSRAVE